MTEINKISLEFKDKFKDDIKLISCYENDGNYDMKIKIDNNILIIITNFENYCYINNNDELNDKLLYSNEYKSIESLINFLVQINKIEINKITDYQYDDKYHFFNKLEEKTKININYNLVQEVSRNYINSNKDKMIFHKSISRDLLLNGNQLYNLILNEVKKINTTFDYQHYIEPMENNIFKLKATLFLDNINVEILINLNSKLYPFYPPEIEIVSPKVKLGLYFAVINLNIRKIYNWSSALSLEWILLNLVNKLNPIIMDNIDNKEINEVELAILKLLNITKETNSNTLNIDFDILKVTQEVKSKKYWNSGVGYGSDESKESWSIKNYVKETEIKNLEITECLKLINENISEDLNSELFDFIINFTFGVTLLEIENNLNVYIQIFNFLNKIATINLSNSQFHKAIFENFKNVNDEVSMLLQTNSEFPNKDILDTISQLYKIYNNNEEISINSNESATILSYCDIMKPLQFDTSELLVTHSFYCNKNKKLEPNALKRVISEISSFKNNLPLNYDSTIWVRVPKTNMNLFSFLISGPKGTPYEHGLFLFNAFLPTNYPQKEPSVLLVTTGNGTVRFNPNLYACGKVCLSLLGTWSGQESEKWNPNTSTFLQVLISIQSLILVDDPYFNEPGYQRSINTPEGKQKSKDYNENIRLQTINFGIIDQIINPPKFYEEVVVQHFRLKKDDIINTVTKWVDEATKKKREMTQTLQQLKLVLKNL
jgi:ubiquitin-protein ligase